MKKKAVVLAAGIAFASSASTAWAQFGVPLGAPYTLTAPEFGPGATGAGAANAYTAPQICTPEYHGRGGVDYQCSPGAPSKEKR